MLKFSAFLSCVEVIKCVKFQNPRYKGFKVGIFRISPIEISICQPAGSKKLNNTYLYRPSFNRARKRAPCDS